MPISLSVFRAMYPANGWSSWFGGYVGTGFPSGCPYGVTLRAPGSTGIFAPFNSSVGVKYEIDVENVTGLPIYSSDFQPPVSFIPSKFSLHLDGPESTTIIIIYYAEAGAPLFIYAQELDRFWPNMRKKLTIPGPGPPPLPLLSKIGPFVEITPWNARGFKLLP